MGKRQKYHVVPTPKGWGVKSEGSSRNIKNFDNKDAAVDFGRDQAKNQDLGQLVIHKKDGKIQTEHTYKKDPYPPKG